MKKKTLNPVMTGVAGAVVGAGLGAAAGSAMSNTQTRKKVEKVVRTVRKQAADYIKSMDTEKNIKAGKRAVSKMASSITDGRKISSGRKSTTNKTKGRKSTSSTARRTIQK